MSNKYWARELEAIIKKAVNQFPAVVLTGPRQSGKTTLLLNLFGKSHRYVTLDDPQIRSLAINDPKLFLEKNPAPVIIDEIQYAPELLPYLKIQIDQQREKKGQCILTGSQQFSLMQGVTESLAGRTAVLTLLPMSWSEILRQQPSIKLNAETLSQSWIKGSFPELVVNPEIDPHLWYAGYLQTYLERDVRSLRQIGDLGTFQIFLQSLAAHNGQLLNLSELSRDLGIAINTVKAWIRVLEASYQIYLLRPYYKNMGKRLIKAPKIYFIDLGLLCYLIGLKDPQHAIQGPAAGSLLETAVFGEIFRSFINSGEIPKIFFWRTAKGEEVDFIMESNTGLMAIETKLSKTPSASLASSLISIKKLFGAELSGAHLVCLTEKETPLNQDINAEPFSWLLTGLAI